MDIHVYNDQMFRQTCETEGEREIDRDRRFWSVAVMTLDEHNEYYAISSLSNREVRREENKQIVIFKD